MTGAESLQQQLCVQIGGYGVISTANMFLEALQQKGYIICNQEPGCKMYG